jgi:putative flippase GtrA
VGTLGDCHLIHAGVDTLLISKVTGTPLFRFIIVGGAAFVLDAGVVWGLTHLGLSAYVARAISLCVSVAFTFVLNRVMTFQASGPVTLQEASAYIGASGIGMAINYLIYVGCLKLGLSWLPAMVLGTGSASAFNFLAYGRIFKKA